MDQHQEIDNHVDDEQDIDGCDCPIEDADATPDEDLPAADGGVA
jgi:hypothetical protein